MVEACVEPWRGRLKAACQPLSIAIPRGANGQCQLTGCVAQAFTNAQVRVPSAVALQTASPATPWEKPTKIFSQVSPKRSPETTQGPDPLSESGP
ncbi:hypothetical protein Srubr_61370 [Streptomyces rubradiris]|uniref:Uncharacterized protein n=1 Tax=Streptomyces rubradiris TaxID=285531 RepID=A0ABQ3RKA6_STRRR|nr:hypothetical protein GCM10018792_61980 [Streptomyces rubradiris]GHI56291.1 hypothetical protein Srubr_61370 [Streptomyces rubradiris]